MPTMLFAPPHGMSRDERNAIIEGKCVKLRRQDPLFSWERPDGEIAKVQPADVYDALKDSTSPEVKIVFGDESGWENAARRMDVLLDVEINGVSITKLPSARVKLNGYPDKPGNLLPIMMTLSCFTRVEFETPEIPGPAPPTIVVHGLMFLNTDAALGQVDSLYSGDVVYGDGLMTRATACPDLDMSLIMRSSIIQADADVPDILSSPFDENVLEFDPPEPPAPVDDPPPRVHSANIFYQDFVPY